MVDGFVVVPRPSTVIALDDDSQEIWQHITRASLKDDSPDRKPYAEVVLLTA